MIVRERRETFTLIEQHEHAQLSGRLAAHWGNQRIPAPPAPSEALILAAGLHDIGWRELDRHPAWDEAAQEPVAFKALPPSQRAPHYTHGIDQVEEHDLYAALLCSLHYVSFFPPDSEAAQDAQVAQFLAGEEQRQKQLRTKLQSAGRVAELGRLEFDLGLLKLWDHLSLYVALNHPGVPKKGEHPWYRKGFPPTLLAYGAAERVRFWAHWLDNKHIAIDPFPFESHLNCKLAIRTITRAEISAVGIAAAYGQAPRNSQDFTFVPDPVRTQPGHA